MTIFDKINNGDYKPQTMIPSKPKKPANFDKPAGQLSEDEFAQLRRDMVIYDDLTTNYINSVALYNGEKNSLLEQFYDDLCEEYHVDHGCPFVEKVYALAWDRGHAYGLHDVAVNFSDMVDLIRMYNGKS